MICRHPQTPGPVEKNSIRPVDALGKHSYCFARDIDLQDSIVGGVGDEKRRAVGRERKPVCPEPREAVRTGFQKLVVHEGTDGPAGEIDLEYVAPEGVGDVQVARRVERDRVEAAARGATADGKNLGRRTGVGKRRRREFDHVATAKICHVEIARRIECQS